MSAGLPDKTWGGTLPSSDFWPGIRKPKVVSAFVLPMSLEFQGRPACMTEDGQMWVMGANHKWEKFGTKVGE